MILFFCFGLIVGSFLNVAVLRHRARSFRGRSSCLSCNRVLRWFELIPVASFFIQKGRCRTCKARLSWQYPLVEILTGFVFAAVFWKLSSLVSSSLLFFSLHSLLFAAFWSFCIFIVFYDVRHKIIPDCAVCAVIVLSLLILLMRFLEGGFYRYWWLDIAGGALLPLPFVLLWFFSKGRAMGLGDAKLLVSFSWVLGFAQGLSALFIGFWLGAAFALAGFALQLLAPSLLPQRFLWLNSRAGGLTMKTELPLAPFLIVGLFAVYLLGVDVTGLSLLL